MQTIQIVVDEDLLRAADRHAEQAKLNRSALVREALRTYLKRLEIRDKERRDREGYERSAGTEAELCGWEKVAAWPEGSP